MPLIPTVIPSNPVVAGFSSVVYSGDQLIAGDAKLVTEQITIAAGNLTRGAVLGKVTATGNYILSVKTAADGSQTPCAVLVDDANATAGPVISAGYFSGQFSANAITFDASWTAQQIKDALRPLSIFIKPVMNAANPT